ncbi:MAG: hypothetical protein ACR2PL_14410 [Dehalococcoidia bacterium]
MQQKVSECSAGGTQVLAIVEDEQERAAGEELDQRIDVRAARLIAKAKG